MNEKIQGYSRNLIWSPTHWYKEITLNLLNENLLIKDIQTGSNLKTHILKLIILK
jgi:hypothetical protein